MTAPTTIFDLPDRGSCPECGRNLVLRDGTYGEFLGCSGWPGCDYTEQVGDHHAQGDYSGLGRDDDGHWR